MSSINTRVDYRTMNTRNEQVVDEMMRRLVDPSPEARALTASELLNRIDLADLRVERSLSRLLRAPFPFVLDTEFFRSAFQFQLRYGGEPRSLRTATDDTIRLFMAEETLDELFEKKLPKFASDLGVPSEDLERILTRWLRWITVVALPAGSDDPRVAEVVARDSSDRPAACLAALLSPCVLLTNDKDFEALLGAVRQVRHVAIVDAAVELEAAAFEVQAMVTLPALPVAGVAGGVRWTAGRIGTPATLVLGTAIVIFAFLLYRRLDEDNKAAIRSAAASAGRAYLRQLAEVQEKTTAARKALEQRVVPPPPRRSSEQLVLRELAVVEQPMSAQRIWERLDPDARPGVQAVRAILRVHPSAEGWGRGTWTLGYRITTTDQ